MYNFMKIRNQRFECLQKLLVFAAEKGVSNDYKRNFVTGKIEDFWR